MTDTIPYELVSTIEELRKEVATLSARLAKLEPAAAVQAGPVAPAPAIAAEAPKPEQDPEITEEELLAISAAIAAYLGVRAHIRQIRLISSPAWAQRAAYQSQASHRLHS